MSISRPMVSWLTYKLSKNYILIPKRYLEEANIKNDVRFIGVDNTIEVWNKQDAEGLLSQPETLANSLEEMMNAPQECK